MVLTTALASLAQSGLAAARRRRCEHEAASATRYSRAFTQHQTLNPIRAKPNRFRQTGLVLSGPQWFVALLSLCMSSDRSIRPNRSGGPIESNRSATPRAVRCTVSLASAQLSHLCTALKKRARYFGLLVWCTALKRLLVRSLDYSFGASVSHQLSYCSTVPLHSTV